VVEFRIPYSFISVFKLFKVQAGGEIEIENSAKLIVRGKLLEESSVFAGVGTEIKLAETAVASGMIRIQGEGRKKL
jgi:hypothetical protein